MQKGEKASLVVVALFGFLLVSASHAPQPPPGAAAATPEAAVSPGEIPVIAGHRPLTSAGSKELEVLARRLAEAAEREPAAFETLLLVLSREDGGLYKRAIALQALRLAGHGSLADQVLARDPHAADLDRIARSLDRGSHLARR